MSADNRGRRIVERGDEWRAIEIRKTVPMIVMANDRVADDQMADNRHLIVQ